MIAQSGFTMAAIAVAIEYFIGYPKPLFAAISHPVVWIGKLITLLDETLNNPDIDPDKNKLLGVAAVVILTLCAIIPAWIIAWILATLPFGWVINILLATVFIAQKSMRDHVSDVAKALAFSIPSARNAVAKIVGRDTSTLDESGVSKAALESLAENMADGIVAPVLWYALFGLPGIVFYKVINTADSMIGYKSEKYLYFGWAAARLDDLINLPASRITGALFALATLSSNRASDTFKAMWRDASKHHSPNAGWPESAMAGALGLRFGGPRNYDGEIVDLPRMGNGRQELTRADIGAGLKLFDRAMAIQFGILLTLAIAL
jgi:adenosylcobinamide-phosphate synthase